jgi:peptide/nickel transport system ATP-binding protein
MRMMMLETSESTTANRMGSLRISNVSVVYGIKQNPLRALEDVSLEIPLSGFTVGVVGESGSGKTTLGMSIMNLIEPPGKIVSGRIEYMNRNVLGMGKEELRQYRWKEVAMVHQSAMNSLNPVKKVVDHIIEVQKAHVNIFETEARENALRLLSEMGIAAERAFDYPHELSGGMKQRVAIAMSIVLSPRLLIADEPTSALDVVVQKQILALLKEQVLRRKLSLIFITHEIAILSGLVDYVAVMFKGKVMEYGPLDDVLFDPLHPYTEMLLNSILSVKGTRSGKLPPFDPIANVARDPIGCRYSGTCKYVFEKCRIETPVLLQVQNGRWVACHKY